MERCAIFLQSGVGDFARDTSLPDHPFAGLVPRAISNAIALLTHLSIFYLVMVHVRATMMAALSLPILKTEPIVLLLNQASPPDALLPG